MGKRGLPQVSCDPCRLKKVRCDREERIALGGSTCSNCSARGLDCRLLNDQPSSSSSLRRKRRRVDPLPSYHEEGHLETENSSSHLTSSTATCLDYSLVDGNRNGEKEAQGEHSQHQLYSRVITNPYIPADQLSVIQSEPRPLLFPVGWPRSLLETSSATINPSTRGEGFAGGEEDEGGKSRGRRTRRGRKKCSKRAGVVVEEDGSLSHCQGLEPEIPPFPSHSNPPPPLGLLGVPRLDRDTLDKAVECFFDFPNLCTPVCVRQHFWPRYLAYFAIFTGGDTRPRHNPRGTASRTNDSDFGVSGIFEEGEGSNFWTHPGRKHGSASRRGHDVLDDSRTRAAHPSPPPLPRSKVEPASEMLILAIACRGVTYTNVPDRFDLQQTMVQRFRSMVGTDEDDGGGKRVLEHGLDGLEALVIMSEVQVAPTYEQAWTLLSKDPLKLDILSHEATVKLILLSGISNRSSVDDDDEGDSEDDGDEGGGARFDPERSERSEREKLRRSLIFWNSYVKDCFRYARINARGARTFHEDDVDVPELSEIPALSRLKGWIDAIGALGSIGRDICRLGTASRAQRVGICPRKVIGIYKRLREWDQKFSPNLEPAVVGPREGGGGGGGGVGGRPNKLPGEMIRKTFLKMLHLSLYMSVEFWVTSFGMEATPTTETQPRSSWSPRASTDLVEASKMVRLNTTTAVQGISSLVLRSLDPVSHQSSVEELAKPLLDHDLAVLRNVPAGAAVWSINRLAREIKERRFASVERLHRQVRVLLKGISTATSHPDTVAIVADLEAKLEAVLPSRILSSSASAATSSSPSSPSTGKGGEGGGGVLDISHGFRVPATASFTSTPSTPSLRDVFASETIRNELLRPRRVEPLTREEQERSLDGTSRQGGGSGGGGGESLPSLSFSQPCLLDQLEELANSIVVPAHEGREGHHQHGSLVDLDLPQDDDFPIDCQDLLLQCGPIPYELGGGMGSLF
ncbi:hypothetical protein IE53DRAFT_390449 [Violaceomyces palustris]|uniref:Uncharacterized protein n=1 Tax=Violaceomyces palustris TaxID=1673888 RepID=A0ACD0NNM1_9BASI|nr:hypothetical protein IE53DRAFT_390449 [Violaceomyces palustris]